MPTVSVIIPNYNHAKYLRRRIDSVLGQTFEDFEVILLDDCSIDESREVLESYRDNEKVTHIVYRNRNSGSPFRQWDRGVALAAGSYIWIAESDDWCEPNFLEVLLQPLKADSQCIISYCQSYMVDDGENILAISQSSKLQQILPGNQFVKEHMVKSNAIWNASMAVWRKAAYTHVSNDFLTYKFCGDWLFWVRLAIRGTVSIDGRVLNYYRKHNRDVSGPVYRSGYNFIEELRLLSTLYKEGIITDAEYTVGYKSKFKDFWNRRHRFNASSKEEILKCFRKPASAKTSYTKTLGSAIWENLKHPSRKF